MMRQRIFRGETFPETGERKTFILLGQFLAGNVSRAAFWQSCPACRSLRGAAALSGIFTSRSWAKPPGRHYSRWDVSCLRRSKVYIAFQLLPTLTRRWIGSESSGHPRYDDLSLSQRENVLLCRHPSYDMHSPSCLPGLVHIHCR